jgi:hypothetical protein
MAPEEAEAARWLLGCCGDLVARPRDAAGRLLPSAEDADLRRRLTRAIETLGRRGSAAIPAAALGRAALADLHGDSRTAALASAEAEQKLGLLGF